MTDEVENTLNEKHLIRQASLTPSPRGEGSRRGFTIVELVIALSVIVIVSGISIGVVAVNNKTYGETIDMIEATNIAENAIECFRYAVNNGGDDVKATFENSLAKSININFDPNSDDDNNKTHPFVVPSEAVDGVYTYNISDGRVIVELKANFTEKKITITAHNNDGADDLFDGPVTYTVR